MIKKRKVVIVGAGNVGASTAFCMINQGICDEIVLIDMNTERAKGETLDMIHSIAFMNRNMEIKLGELYRLQRCRCFGYYRKCSNGQGKRSFSGFKIKL